MVFDSSYGTIVFNPTSQEPKVLMVKHQKGHWSFPKGHPEGEESQPETALRETKEECGLDVKIIEDCPTIDEKYIYTNPNGELVNKRVRYFLAAPIHNTTPKPQISEIEICQWLSFDQAMAVITFPEAKKVFKIAMELFSKHRKSFSQL